MTLPFGLLAALLSPQLRSRVGRLYRSLFFIGSRYNCPFCKSNLNRYLPFGLTFPVLSKYRVVGGGYRPNALCPICSSLDRERLLLLYLQRKSDIFDKPTTLLHVAPEEQLTLVLQSTPNIDYVTADLSAPHVMSRIDVTALPFRDSTFDAIICNHVLEHIVDDRRALRELHRVLKPEGWAILQVPIALALENTYEDFSIVSDEGRERAFGQHDHVRIYAGDYVSRLANSGFAVTAFDWLVERAKFGGPRNIFGLNENERMYIARKLHE
jgi:SAM-dependent methyltransferase